jgi:hypothetical protein
VTAASGPAALERLAAALDPSGFAVILVTRVGSRPRLAVVDRRTCAGEDIYADDRGWFWWPWAEPVAATGDPLAAAHRVTAALRGTTPPGDQR